MATQKFLVTTDNTDMYPGDMLDLIENERVGNRPQGTRVEDVTDRPEPTSNLVWKVKRNGNVVAATTTAEDALALMKGLAAFTAEGLDGWSIHFDMAVV